MWGDDIGQSNLSCYTFGLMGYRTPNIDGSPRKHDVHRLVRRAELHGGTVVVHHRSVRPAHRLTKVGLPGAELGSGRRIPPSPRCSSPSLPHGPVRQEPPRRPRRAPADDARLRRVLRQLYHLNAEEEPEDPTTRARRTSELQEAVRAARRAHCWADGKGGQKIENTAPHQEADGDGGRGVPRRRQDVHQGLHDADEPFFVWFNTTHMHAWTHVKPESRGQAAGGSPSTTT